MSVMYWKIGKYKEGCDTCDSKNDKTPVYARARGRGVPRLFHICCRKEIALVDHSLVVARTLVDCVE